MQEEKEVFPMGLDEQHYEPGMEKIAEASF